MRYRYERKYLVRNEDLGRLRKRLDPFVRPDIYAPEGIDGKFQYTVRSIYFDTPGFDALYEKVEGIEVRKKLRVRGYDKPGPNQEVFLEIKRKRGDRIWKNRARVYFDSLEDLFQFGLKGNVPNISQINDDEAKRFLFNYHRYAFRKVNLVVYDREPFHGSYDPGVRITFDKNIRCKMWPELKELFSDAGLRLVWKDHFILEVKYFEDKMPSWARSIVQEFGLKHQALSKYVEPLFIKDISIYNTKLGG